MDYIYIILPFLPFVMELFTSDRMQWISIWAVRHRTYE
jgi:hypothetical protein